MNLKNQLKHYLSQKDISSAQLSKKSGVSKQVISLWLSGGKPRNVEQIKKVAEVLSTTVDNLCFGIGSESKRSSFADITEDEWFSGAFEIKVRRIKR